MSGVLTRIGVAVGAVFAALIVAISGIVFVWASLYLVLADYMIAPLAAFLTGLSAFVVAALIVFGGFWFAGRAKKRNAPPNARDMASMLGAILGQKATGRAREGVVASFLAGFALAVSPGLRRLLKDFLRK